MIKIIKVSGFENENVEKLTLMEEKSGLLGECVDEIDGKV